jgi:hypothetical protein
MNARWRLLKRNFNGWRRSIGERHRGWIYLAGAMTWSWVKNHSEMLAHQAGPAYLELCHRTERFMSL